MKVPGRRPWLAAPLAACLAAVGAHGADEIGPGSYCPIPKPGERPACLEPAKARYGDFFQAVDAGEVDDARLSRVEAELATGASSQNAYLALSSLAYGYYRLSQRAARTPDADPEIAARLERWNAILGEAYEVSAEEDDFREALRQAAFDLQRRAPPVRIECLDERGEAVGCDSTDAVMRGIDRKASDVGIRGGLERLLDRMVGGNEP